MGSPEGLMNFLLIWEEPSGFHHDLEMFTLSTICNTFHTVHIILLLVTNSTFFFSFFIFAVIWLSTFLLLDKWWYCKKGSWYPQGNSDYKNIDFNYNACDPLKQMNKNRYWGKWFACCACGDHMSSLLLVHWYYFHVAN